MNRYFVLLVSLLTSTLAFGTAPPLIVNGALLSAGGKALVIAAPAPPTACNYYIGTSGSDANPGTEGSPWAITGINSKKVTYTGKTVCLLDGTYNVYSLFASLGHDGYVPALSVQGGTLGSPTIITAVNARQAIIQANSGATYPPNNPVIGNSDASNKQYVTIDGLVITGHSSKGIYLGNYAAAAGGTHYVGYTVKNCEITGQNGTSLSAGNNLSSIEMAGASGALIQNNYFHDNTGYASLSSDHLSATLQWLSIGSTYEYNTLIQTSNIYGKENGNQGTVIRYNYIDNTGWGNTPAIYDFVGVPSDSPSGITNEIHHNIAVGATGLVFRPSLSSGYFLDPALIYNNTILTVNSGQTISLGGRANDNLLSSYNNIVSSSASGDQNIAIWNVGGLNVVDYNYYYNSSAYQYGYFSSKSSDTRNNANFTTYKSTLGSIEAHSVSPGSTLLFVGSGARADFYKLQSGSPAKNFGKSDGTTGGSTVDAGAWGNSPPTHIGCDF